MGLSSSIADLGFRIKGFIPLSMLDWPGKMCSVIFLGGCNFRCPACHNSMLVLRPQEVPDYSLEDMISYLANRKGWIDGVTVTGGEPTVNPRLERLLELIGRLGFRRKLDTNGSNPHVLEGLLERGMVDAVSMDIKAPLEEGIYSSVAGIRTDVRKIERSISLIKSSGIEFFFRTTVLPGFVEECHLEEIRRVIGSDSPYILQSFRNKDTLDPKLATVPECDLERFEAMKERFGIGTATLTC